MLVAHAVPLLGVLPAIPSAVFQMLTDVASPLFALAIGMAGVIVLRRRDATAAGLIASKVAQGLMLILIGLALASLPTWVWVVLPQLGMLLIVGAPLLFLPARWLGLAAGIAFAAGPLVSLLTGLLVPPEWVTYPDEGPEVLQWFVTGQQYRLTSLLPFFLFGAFLHSTQALRRVAPCRVMTVTGVGLTLVTYPAADFARSLDATFLVTSGGYIDLVRDLGLVLLTVGLVGTAALIPAGTMGGITSRLLSALAGPGELALSLYVAHVLLLVPIFVAYTTQSQGIQHAIFAAYILGLLLFGWFWSRYLGRGPIERGTTWVGKTVRMQVDNGVGRKAGGQ